MSLTGLFLTVYEIDCPSPERFFSELAENAVEALGISVSEDGSVTLAVRISHRRRLERLLKDRGTNFRILREGAFCRLPKLIKARVGLLIGAAVWTVTITAAQYFLLTVDVLTENDRVREEVLNIMRDDGVTIGCYIPDIRCVELERDLKQRVRSISWAGVSITDSRLVIDVIERVEKPEFHYERMPSNLVAKHSGTIEEAEIYSGLLKKPKGSGVLRGELLVSGHIPVNKIVERDGKKIVTQSEKCVRSIGTLYGRYTEVRTFEQPFTERGMIMNGKRDDRSYLRIFGAEIPLFIGGDSELYREEESYSPLTVFDTELPVGIKRVKREGYGFSAVNYTREQAAVRADEKRKLYEENFLGEEKILSRKFDTEYTEESVKLTVTYELYGVMSEERQFFVKKDVYKHNSQ